jgi:hypothetical protein
VVDPLKLAQFQDEIQGHLDSATLRNEGKGKVLKTVKAGFDQH